MSQYSRIQDTRLFRTWESINGRCHNPNYSGYDKYGAKGITVCNTWQKHSNAFMAWALLNGYTDKLTIERIDFTKGYSPENCMWIPLACQAGNRGKSNRNTSGYVGVNYHTKKKGWIARVTIEGRRKEIGKFSTAEEAHLARKQYFIDNDLAEHLRVYELQHRN